MKKLNYFVYFILAVFFLSGCQDVKKGFSSKKLDQGNEFLVIKKNPLELPPNFNEMPEPKGDTNISGSNSNSAIEDNNSENSFWIENAGLLFEDGDEEGIAKCILKLIDEPNQAIKFGENGRSRIKKDNDYNTEMKKVNELYLKI